MFEYLRFAENIIVVGAHRSGTTFAAHAIAYSLGRVAYDERFFNFRRIDELEVLLSQKKKAVIQAPMALPWLPILTNPSLAAVFIHRPEKEIKRSFKFSRTPNRRSIPPAPFTPGQALRMWYSVVIRIHHPYETNYADLQHHPLFVPKAERHRWHYKQVDPTGKWYRSAAYNVKN